MKNYLLNKTSRALVYLSGSFLLFSSSFAASQKIELDNSAIVQAEVLSEHGDKVVVDLGFDVISIPKSKIVEQSKIIDKTPLVQNKDLFFEAPQNPVLSVKELVETVGESVVLIRSKVGLGSGFFINENGYIITNNHVISGEHEFNVTVFQGNGKNMQKSQYTNVRIIASSPENDLALLKLEDIGDKKFKAVPLANYDDVKQGVSVFALGSPLGLERSVSSGIVSLKNREMSGWLYIQTTAQINPGNSGGPLFNMRGQVIGVNNMKLTGGAEGLGFAIPCDTVKFFIKNRDGYAFDPRNPNTGVRYTTPPCPEDKVVESEK